MVVDAAGMSRLGIVTIINAQEDLKVCAELGELAAAREVCVRNQPELVVLDLELSRGDGLELLRDLTNLSPLSRAVVVSHFEDAESVQRAFRLGARAFLSKADEPSELIAAIRCVLEDELFASRHISHVILRLVAQGAVHGDGRGVALLSDRELQIFRLIGRGLGAKVIAAELGLSIRTIETHQSRIKAKLELRSCAELQQFAAGWRQTQEIGSFHSHGIRN